jgi:DNA polymerase-3 subunit epsilon
MPLLAVGGFGVVLAAGAAGVALWRHHAGAPARLAGQIQVLAASGVDRLFPAQGSAGSRALAGALNALLDERRALKADISARAAEAARGIEQERERLASLMAELAHSVVVCNVDGRILLYNHRARLQFRALSQAPDATRGAELLGLGRSIYGVFDRELVDHALDSLRDRLQRGAAHPSAQFVTTTRGGQLLRAQLAPVRAALAQYPVDPSGATPVLAGFVLLLDNLTQDHAEALAHDDALHALALQARAALQLGGDAATPLEALLERNRQARSRRWPLEDMRASDLLAAATRRIAAELHLKVSAQDPRDEGPGETSGTVAWLRVDSYVLVRCLVALAAGLVTPVNRVNQADAGTLRLSLQLRDDGVALALCWDGAPPPRESAKHEVAALLTRPAPPLADTVGQILERHSGTLAWREARGGEPAALVLVLPTVQPRPGIDEAEANPPPPEGLRGSRPAFYDFDLFSPALAASGELADRPLAALSFTVFDTETTGLDPSGGDEILQIGATRVVAGKVRRHECYEQLVDPRRPIPAATIPIHGIEPAMVRGQPSLDVVLPAFHAFAADTVLVAHNAAFDMRFLQLKEAATGVRFEQPVLDTLLLSAVLHPDEPSHRLEEIAARFGVTVTGRHTALGDAFVTAEIFERMVPMLAARGLVTLGQVIEASRRTRFAQVTY